ncbi:MAG: response regulator [Planctomycetes bacterium]|nr:response regulator [Planctomycetota bacterium]
MNAPENAIKVLLVDDDLSLRGVTATHLRKAGYDVEVGVNGKEGLDMAISNPPDVIVSDIMMPIMDGVEMLKNVRAQDSLKDCYVILLTAKDRTVDMVEGFDATADDYLTKPFKMAELTARVKAGARLKIAQDKLKDANEKLREALQQNAELLGIAAHDLRNPISIITTYISLLGQGVVPDESIKEVCLRRAQGLNGLIDNLLDISKIDAGKVQLSREQVNLSLLLRESVELYQPVALQREVKLTSTSPDGVAVMCDRNRMIEILNTVFDIALSLSPEGGEVISELACNGSEAIFTISTPGGGIEPEKVALLFRPALVSEVIEGYEGKQLLGLAIVKKLVEMHGGTIFVDSTGIEHGVTFGFTLKL